MRELQTDVSLRVNDTDSTDAFEVCGRGELHLSILIENMRRQGYEFAVTKPQVLYKTIDGELCGVFAISYEKTRSATAGLSTLSSYRKLNPVMIANEFMMSESFIRTKFGIKSKRLLFPEEQTRMALRMIEAEESAQAALLTTTVGLAPMAFCVTGARSLQLSCNLGVILHMVGGILGMAVVLLLLLSPRLLHHKQFH